jgi:hypothetical protein
MRALRSEAVSFQLNSWGDRSRGEKGKAKKDRLAAFTGVYQLCLWQLASRGFAVLLPFSRVVVLYLYAHRVSYGKA